MSTLGKILTVLIALVAIPVSVLVSREFFLRENWRSKYQETNDLFQRALKQRDQWYQNTQEANRFREADKKSLQDTINAQINTIAGLRDQLTIQGQEKAALDKKLSTLSDSYDAMSKQLTQLVTERQDARIERDDAKKRADDLQKMYSELDVRYRDTDAKLKQAIETVLILREDKAELEKVVADAVKQGYKPPAVAVESPVKLSGLVTASDTENRVAEINLGTDDGVVAPMVFYVYDPKAGEFLAKLTIKQVSHDRAVGDLTMVRGKVEVGNHVTNRFD